MEAVKDRRNLQRISRDAPALYRWAAASAIQFRDGGLGRNSLRNSIATTAALALADMSAAILSFVMVSVLVAGRFEGAAAIQVQSTFAIVSAGMFAYLACRGHYSRRMPFWTWLRHIVVASAVALLFSLSAAFVTKSGINAVAAVVWLVFPLLSVLLRQGLRRILDVAGIWQIRTVVVGHGDSTAVTVTALESEPWLGYAVTAVITPEELHQLQPDRRWQSVLKEYGAAMAVLSLDAELPVDRDLVSSLVRERVPFAIAPQHTGLPVLGFEQTQFFSHDTMLVTYRNNLAQPIPRLVKGLFDVTAAALGLVLAAPVFLIIAVLVKLDGGPVFYGHRRVGAGGRTFPCLKFRSMVVDSDAKLEEHLAANPAAMAEWVQTRKLRADPRITRVGRVLRTTSLDELPQLLNVLRLEMSLVGPRPIVRAETHHYGDDIAFYYETRPGLTGLWQVSGRTGTTFARRVELDCWYVKNWTLWHDIAILAKTVPAVLTRRGAV